MPVETEQNPAAAAAEPPAPAVHTGHVQHGTLHAGDDYCSEHEIGTGVLFGMGNPLLDISVHVSEEFLAKYGLQADDQILAKEEHLPMFHEISEKPGVEFIPGGATQNAIKFAQWLLRKPESTVFMGCIGKDRFGEILLEKAESIGVSVHYQYTDAQPTGTAACLLTGTSRSLVANLAAANCFTVSHLEEPQHWHLVERAQYYYIAAFFLTVCPPAQMMVAKHALAHNKLFSMNLAAPFISQFFLEPLLAAMPYIDILFGNEHEAQSFGKAMDMGVRVLCVCSLITSRPKDDIRTIALKTAALPKLNANRKRIVIFTQGAQPTIVVEGDVVTEYPVIPIAPGDIVDTNGAGDAFAGGFLSQLVQKKSLKECMRCANYAANLVIKRSGCTFPPGPPDYK